MNCSPDAANAVMLGWEAATLIKWENSYHTLGEIIASGGEWTVVRGVEEEQGKQEKFGELWQRRK